MWGTECLHGGWVEHSLQSKIKIPTMSQKNATRMGQSTRVLHSSLRKACSTSLRAGLGWTPEHLIPRHRIDRENSIGPWLRIIKHSFVQVKLGFVEGIKKTVRICA